MTLKEQVYVQAAMMAGELDAKQDALLKTLCHGAVSSLAARLREGLTPEDCKADFIAGASLYALSALGTAAQGWGIREFKAGDLTVVPGSPTDAASRCLRKQAELVMGPYLRSGLVFLGV